MAVVKKKRACIGIDGCPAEWFYVRLEGSKASFGIVASIYELETVAKPDDRVLIDIPIGLPSQAVPERRCEREARRVLGPRKSSVFPVPSRKALSFDDYERASQANQRCVGKKLTKQTWAICPKISEVDDYLRQSTNPLPLREMHPELCFWSLNDKQPMAFPKKDGLGCVERLRVLEGYWPGAYNLVVEARERYPVTKMLATDDIIDALVGAVSGVLVDSLSALPTEPQSDECGLPMGMVYASI